MIGASGSIDSVLIKPVDVFSWSSKVRFSTFTLELPRPTVIPGRKKVGE